MCATAFTARRGFACGGEKNENDEVGHVGLPVWRGGVCAGQGQGVAEEPAEGTGRADGDVRDADERASKGGVVSTLLHAAATPFSSLNNLYNNSVSNESLFQIQSDIIWDKAKAENCIIVGRCADYILRKHPRHLNIFIRANMDDRIQRVRDREMLSVDDAKEMIELEDRKRSEYHDLYCETNWGDSRAYDLCVNSSLLGIDATAQFLLDYVKQYFGIE